jgi:hypothetical protein
VVFHKHNFKIKSCREKAQLCQSKYWGAHQQAANQYQQQDITWKFSYTGTCLLHTQVPQLNGCKWKKKNQLNFFHVRQRILGQIYLCMWARRTKLARENNLFQEKYG